MINEFSRTELLLGRQSMQKLEDCSVLLFGVGGVGGFAAEALCRCGVGQFTLVDSDTVSLTNLNRQVIALHSTIGQYKTDVMERRMQDINPMVQVESCRCFYTEENAEQFDFTKYDYIIDAVDTVSSKLLIAQTAYQCGIPSISAMGAGNKLDPTRFRIADIFETQADPLARVMRRELRKRGVPRLKVVYSDEPAKKPLQSKETPAPGRRVTPGSVSFVPSVEGLVLASAVIHDLTAPSEEKE
ncbi:MULTISPECIES: tRNA threonylcarbamoyladenosine dehydratase [Caproicibacterium]|mgnify:CR=1 FL=1|uniref:tRNA threonylcarbamoyladenosine dehydratase n=1 Tax=Caproicibacterium lactatifermentans TaxID=2666138 RepID=A0A859DPY0_9FIRM|nr:tRNA threonylcarbamoyladenosine dehydratase [Caproicibacterium lactatifermentans]ARP50515.1 tRNA threonylcarbamoyladenosine dehydratase [Ruminococcaceae bacterium CPB6]MDD4807384.1 tRNA threonylcarbamoyladenosine dehydratase [Oscillospiraceae bacterium]QKN23766.1 tRNA threonylcarbamoyladenosine dehydratase [Caproicibacterium lactatifermentans]QKO29600.1 tRNA threonylcarbamoyladenosine dehydratase [Caproicibacterium lactatifermentans]